MRRCIVCGATFDGTGWQCPACGYEPLLSGEMLAFAPEGAAETTGFRPEHFVELASIEENNFWFAARNRLIVRALKRWAPGARSMLEIGCGTGFVLRAIDVAFPGMRLSGTEVLVAGLPYAAKRVPRATLMQMDARAIPFEREFDAIGAFDVLEHIDEDETVIQQVWRALRPGGVFVITVPQHKFLWSRQDEYACHVRRYEAGELRSKLARAGFKVRYLTSFVSLLLPVLYVSRLRKRAARTFDATDEAHISPAANWILGAVMRAEGALISVGLRFPAGGSLLAVATKER